MKKTLITALVGFALAACQESLEEQAARQAAKFTRERCPLKMEMLVLDSMTFDVASRTLSRYYRLTGHADHDSLSARELKAALVDELRNEPTYRVYREHGFNFYYEYRSENHPSLVRFEALLTQEDYGK